MAMVVGPSELRIVCCSISRPFSCNYQRQIGKYIILSLLSLVCVCVCFASLQLVFPSVPVCLQSHTHTHTILPFTSSFIPSLSGGRQSIIRRTSDKGITDGRAGRQAEEGNLDARAQFPCNRYPSIGAPQHTACHWLVHWCILPQCCTTVCTAV